LATTKVRHDKVDKTGSVTLRHRSKLHHIGLGRAFKGQRVSMLICDLDVRVIAEDGTRIRRLTLDPPKSRKRTKVLLAFWLTPQA
jgi:hypothetical protein